MMVQRQLPSKTNQIITICKYELLKSFRGKKIFGILGIVILVSSFFVLFPEIFEIDNPKRVNEYFSTSSVFVFFILVITAAFLGSSSLVSEFQEKTGYSLFPNPVSRTSIWIGKFLAAEIVSFFVIGVFYGITFIKALIIYQTISPEAFVSLAFSLWGLTMIMGVSFLASSLLKSSNASMMLVFFLFVLILPMTDQITISMAEEKPWFSPSFSMGIIENILTVPYPLDLEPNTLPRGPFDHERFVPQISDSLIIITVYTIASCVASLILFKNREMN